MNWWVWRWAQPPFGDVSATKRIHELTRMLTHVITRTWTMARCLENDVIRTLIFQGDPLANESHVISESVVSVSTHHDNEPHTDKVTAMDHVRHKFAHTRRTAVPVKHCKMKMLKIDSISSQIFISLIDPQQHEATEKDGTKDSQ